MCEKNVVVPISLWTPSHHHQKCRFNLNYTCCVCSPNAETAFWACATDEWASSPPYHIPFKLLATTFDLSWLIWPPALFISRWHQKAILVYILLFCPKTDWIFLCSHLLCSPTGMVSHSKHDMNQILLPCVCWGILLFVSERIQCKDLTGSIVRHWHFTMKQREEPFFFFFFTFATKGRRTHIQRLRGYGYFEAVRALNEQ